MVSCGVDRRVLNDRHADPEDRRVENCGVATRRYLVFGNVSSETPRTSACHGDYVHENQIEAFHRILEAWYFYVYE